jgi:hypothetical protein
MTFDTWAERKRAEAFDIALEKINGSNNAYDVIEECLQAENDVMRALNAHGLLP